MGNTANGASDVPVRRVSISHRVGTNVGKVEGGRSSALLLGDLFLYTYTIRLHWSYAWQQNVKYEEGGGA